MLNSGRKFKHNRRASTLSSRKGDGSQTTDRHCYKGCGCTPAKWSAETKTTEEYIDYREGLWDHGEISSHDVSSYSPLFIIDESRSKRKRVGEREWLSKREREHTLCSLVSSGPYFGIWMLNILGARRLMMYTMQKYLSLYILDIQIGDIDRDGEVFTNFTSARLGHKTVTTPLFKMRRGADWASGLTEAIRSIISTTVEGLMRTIVSV